jgi:hypothetical protein
VRRSVAIALLVLTYSLTACVGPARTPSDYRLKARHSAQEANSAVATSRMAAQLVRDRAAFAAYVAVVLDSAETDASSVASTFASIQPPDLAADRLRSDLSSVLNDVVDTISGMRIAARRHDWATLLVRSRSLGSLARALQPFEELSA